ncbi:MAG: hypothetical protein OJF50_001267 [Nitrospira sp.]|jgi:hypothetical protein|nr:hypothetical protein [Nitrospira sp.]
MITTERTLTRDHLMDLERMVTALDNRLQSIQGGLQRIAGGSLVERFRIIMRFKQRSRFMSTVCNQHIRSNTKLASYDGPRA